MEEEKSKKGGVAANWQFDDEKRWQSFVHGKSENIGEIKKYTTYKGKIVLESEAKALGEGENERNEKESEKDVFKFVDEFDSSFSSLFLFDASVCA